MDQTFSSICYSTKSVKLGMTTGNPWTIIQVIAELSLDYRPKCRCPQDVYSARGDSGGSQWIIPYASRGQHQ
ncbi:hypothetical protein Ancab_002272, partial [Ancistrocladus abbreviatus]